MWFLKSWILLNLFYLLQVNFLKAGNLCVLLNLPHCLLLFPRLSLMFSPHFGLISFLHSLSSSLSSFSLSTHLSFPSFLPSLLSLSVCLVFFFHQETILVVLKFFGLQSIFETSKNVEKTLHSSMVRESKEISQEVDSIKTVWNFLDWQIYYYEMITDYI